MSGQTPAIRLDGVSKRYTIWRRRAGGLKDRAIGFVRGQREEREDLWALRHVTLDATRGETLAVIGPNGCGKSTLLQLIAGILVPDEGTCQVNGRVTSLLELGAGFSPDLSGRDNVFLNASLYGVPQEVIARRFDEIVAFAELERFIDTPVRNYSSGMYVRLGFAVAVHLEPEIVLLDEAFAVGDESFQRKCLLKIKEFQEAGVTIVLVSHDLLLVERLATSVCLLQTGTVQATGSPADVIARYHELSAGQSASSGGRRWGSGLVEILDVQLNPETATNGHVLRTRDPLTIRLTYRCHEPVDRPVFGVAIYTDDGVHVTGPNTKTGGLALERIADEGTIEYHVPSLTLLPGRYLISAAVYAEDLITAYDHRDRFKPLVVVEGGSTERFGTVTLGGTWTWSDERQPS